MNLTLSNFYQLHVCVRFVILPYIFSKFLLNPSQAMSEVQTISYAKVVTPSPTNGNELKQDNKMEPREDTEKMSVTEAEVVQQEAADDNEGFQPVTNKKNEKLKEKETQREKDAKKKSKRGKKLRSSKEKDKLKEKDRDKEKDVGSERFDSKESSPTPSKSEEPVEFVPAPPPKTNPWKKPTKPETGDLASTNTAPASAPASASAEPLEKPKPKTERKKKLSEREVTTKTDHGNHNPKGNPWKKVEAAKEPEVPSSPKVIKVEKKSGEPSSWPKLGEEKNKKKKKSTENWSGDSGAASSLDTAEEGKENQVCELLYL